MNRAFALPPDVLLQQHGAQFEQIVVLRRHVAHVILALALVPELGVIAPAAVLAVRDRLRPLEVRPWDWWGERAAPRLLLVSGGIEQSADRARKKQQREHADKRDASDKHGVFPQRLTGFPLSPAPHDLSAFPSSTNRKTNGRARRLGKPSRRRHTCPRERPVIVEVGPGQRDPAHTGLDRAAALLAVQHPSPDADCRRLEGWPTRTGVGGSRTTSSPSTPSVGPGRSCAAYTSGAVLESRSRQPTFPREPQQVNTQDAEISPKTGGSAKGAGVQEARLKGDVRPGAGFAAALPLRGTLRGALCTSATAAIRMSPRDYRPPARRHSYSVRSTPRSSASSSGPSVSTRSKVSRSATSSPRTRISRLHARSSFSAVSSTCASRSPAGEPEHGRQSDPRVRRSRPR
jgi:hypothetical protein